MTETLLVGIVAAASAVLGSAITGLFTYIAARREREFERHTNHLRRAYGDIAALCQLEDMYCKELAREGRSQEAWKREMRKALRESGYNSPSEEATAARCAQRLRDLE
jgi:hypothetical protein